MERKLFTALQGETAETLNDTLSKQGFRRSQNVLYRPTCADCSACMSARVRVENFKPSKSQRRATNKNSYLKRASTAPWATEQQYDLFRAYLERRHADGGMADMDVFEFAAMIEETPIRTRVIEYYTPAKDGQPRKLVATCLTDLLEDGLSMVYSFYDPDFVSDSIGTYIILDHIAIAKEAGLPFVYLGYWVPGSPKMGYKARFSGLEVHRAGEWQSFEEGANYDAELHPLESEPIAAQVAKINLPESFGAAPTPSEPKSS